MTFAMRLQRAVATAALALATTWGTALAESPYELHDSQEWAWIAGGAGAWVGGMLAIGSLTPLSPEAIASLDPDDINGFDRKHMRPYHEDHAGDALAAATYLLPLGFLADDETRHDMDTISVMWLEVTLVNQAIAAVAKATTQRTRPYVYDPGAPAALTSARTARLSFYSAHTAGSSANCFFTAKVLSDYTDSGSAEVAAWSVAAILPLINGYFRVDSGHHFVTDALAGYAMGAAVGVIVPALHRRDEPDTSSGTASLEQSGGSNVLGYAMVAAAGLLPVLHHRLALEPARIDGAPGVVATVKF
jgi:membrane-associated phospholipid phosphatase